MRRFRKYLFAVTIAVGCVGLAMYQIVTHFGPRNKPLAGTKQPAVTKQVQPISTPAVGTNPAAGAKPKAPPTSRMPDVDLDALVKHVNKLCKGRLAILRNPKQTFAHRKEAALTLAKLHYFPAIPTLVDNLMLAAPEGSGKVPDDFPCQQAIKQFGDMSFAYLMDGCRKNYPKEHRLALNKLIKDMGWKDYAVSVCRSYLELPYDATTIDMLNRHIRNFEKDSENPVDQAPVLRNSRS